MTELGFKKVISQFGAQLGEIAWHHITVDATIDRVVGEHSDRVLKQIELYTKINTSRQIRFLELGAYCHYTAYQVASALDAEAVASDISPNALRAGLELANKRGLESSVERVAADFHDLPFSDDYFDVVFVASAIHHTLRTSLILEEMLRVVQPGGILIIENEPIGREFCFYQFRSSRPESMTPWENELLKGDLMNTISSPFIGSRAEELFGMIENDRIPMPIYDQFIAQCDVLESRITPLDDAVGRRVLEIGHDAKQTAAWLKSEVESHRQGLCEVNRLMGFSLPTAESIRRLCEESVGAIENIRSMKDAEKRTHALARFLGGALQVTLRKGTNGQPSRSVSAYRREPPLIDDVRVDVPSLNEVSVELDHVLLPEIVESNRAELSRYFTEEYWILFKEENGFFSMLNRGATSTIMLPERKIDGVLLLRFYYVARPNRPYFLDIVVDEQPIESFAIGVSESRLSKIYLPSQVCSIELTTREPSGDPVTLPASLRVAVCRIVPFRES